MYKFNLIRAHRSWLKPTESPPLILPNRLTHPVSVNAHSTLGTPLVRKRVHTPKGDSELPDLGNSQGFTAPIRGL